MFVGRTVNETRNKEDLCLFQCASCGEESTAFVVGVGMGKGNSVLFLDNEGADRRATESAEKDAEQNIRETVSLARCPKCGLRNRAAVTTFWAKFVAMVVGSSLFIWGLGAFVYALDGSESALWIFGPIGLVTGPLIGWMTRWKWTTVDQRVSFVE